MKLIKESLMERKHVLSTFKKIVEILSNLSSREDMELASRINDFMEEYETKGFPKAELMSLLDDIETFGKKWRHVVNSTAKDKLGSEIIKLKNDVEEPEVMDEQADFDYGVADNYNPNRTYKPIEFVKKGAANIRQKPNNPRFGDNSLEDVTINEEFDLPFDQKIKLDRLQNILNNADVSDDEIIAGIGGLTAEAKKKVANAIDVPEDKVDFMLRLLSTKLSKEDEKNYSLFNESYKHIMEEDSRFGYQDDSIGNVTINDTKTGKSVFLTGSEAATLLNKLFRKPEDTQQILSDYEPLMEDECWSAAGEQKSKQSMSQNIKEKPSEKSKVNKKEVPFDKTIKVSKSRVKAILGEDSAFKKEIDAEDGTYNFPWKINGRIGTGTASFTLVDDKPKISIVSVRDEDGNEISDYNDETIINQAKKFIPEA